MSENSATTRSKSKKSVKSHQMYQIFFDLCLVANIKSKFFKAILFKFKSCLNRRLSMKTIYLWPKIKLLIALSEKNKHSCVMSHPTISKLTGKFQIVTSFTSRLVPVNTN